MEEKTCLSCKTKLVNDRGAVVFPCPQCGNYQIARCSHCRKMGSKYTCTGCNFTGPN